MDEPQYPKLNILRASLPSFISRFVPEIVDLKSVQTAKSIRVWEVVVKASESAKSLTEALENDDVDLLTWKIRECRIACKKCMAYCYSKSHFKNSYHAAEGILTLLSSYSNE